MCAAPEPTCWHRAKALQVDEKQLQVRCVMKIQPVLAPKRLLSFKEMLTDAGVNDEHLFRDVCDGFKLVGDLDPSGPS